MEARKAQDQASALEKAKTTTFQDCAWAYIKTHRSSWKNAKHAEQWSATLETWAYPILGKLPVGGISTDLVLKVLEQPVGDQADGRPSGPPEPRRQAGSTHCAGWYGSKVSRSGGRPS